MAGQNRSSYARSNSGANRGLAAFFRGAFILLVALTLSFGLGFFVIARMIPANTNAGGADSSAGAAQSDHRPKHSASAQTTPQIAAKPARAASPTQDGPVL